MKKVLILGAGMVVKPIVHYLLNNGIAVTIASRTKEKAEKVLEGYRNGKAISWTIDDLEALDNLIINHDITVSLLPYVHHVTVAKKCIQLKKNMVTTSYVSDEMKALNAQAKEANILLLNEIGVDPGLDHMTAMEIIDRVHEEGGKVDEFYSLCGALCAPEASNNPFRYKFSWSPKGVVMASNNNATFLKNNKIVEIETANLFKNPLKIDFPEIEEMEVYPNRNSLPYIDIYKIPEVKIMYRGTFRYKGWCAALDLLKNLNLTTYDVLKVKGKSLSQIVAEINNFKVDNLKNEIKNRFNIDDSHLGLKAIEWLGILDATKIISQENTSTFDIISDLMIDKMMMNKSERDMVIMQHIFNISNKNGKKETIISKMIDYGNDKYTSIAKTVALPAAIAVKLILEGTVKGNGVQIPIEKSVYVPILNLLKKEGVFMSETRELHI
ncbi:saccharopine dehydrogenase C-terminal domain-containing protein [Polaribacter ponticola]|uniref:Saccharopine dehydrogenase C-terminal domain-containing protein n=1 Tax=Polaribacter ponticola TaxID=2978475 RepID=A0ABT5S9R4_9FLAO|nr:saccharopine dehydrogenase C-terminal domain-containing protein [Polaribacter sp. MSW5]MDD7914843.1 saccharopine dehydrogenase C-terminal domain-containing protein [Polaribacter sp. MSW5]